MGALNVSPESFYAGSIHRDRDALVRAGLAMARAGAVILDVGARSTAPYLQTEIGDGEEADRLAAAVEALVTKVGLPVSADTARVPAARAALEAGATILNDVSALSDPEIGRLAAARGASLVLMASPAEVGVARPAAPLAIVEGILTAALRRARAAGVADAHVVLDPGIGFFRDEAVAWDVWDVAVLSALPALATVGRPLCVGVSRKSFLGALTGRRDPAERLAASIAATAIAVMHGAAVIRAHDVAETVDAVRVAQRVLEQRGAEQRGSELRGSEQRGSEERATQQRPVEERHVLPGRSEHPGGWGAISGPPTSHV
jgi:dihydropteroate synthase